jgi:WhiB family transcriptional regulator, redox-sensing transcriptional regulator
VNPHEDANPQVTPGPYRYSNVTDDLDVLWLMTPDLPEIDFLAELLNRPRWQRRGACRGRESDVFIIARGQTGGAARAICLTCPVRQECLEYALAHPEVDGVWGGTSGRERQRIRTARRLAL